jgi:hypothetical protein
VGNGPAISNSEGRSYGAEFLYEQKLFNGFYGIVSYTLFWSQFKDVNDKFVSSSWDTRHIISMTGGKKFKRNWEIGLRYRIQGGTPFTPYDLAASSSFARFNPSAPGILDFNRINSERTGWFHSADIRVTKKWYFKKFSFELYLDVQNFYLSKTPEIPTLTPVYELDGTTPVVDANDPSRFQTKFLSTGRAIPLPTIGVVITY